MADFNADSYDAPATEDAVPTAIPATTTVPGFGTSVTYYKMQAPCSSSASGYINWVNTTGDDTGRPACAMGLGTSYIVDSWTV